MNDDIIYRIQRKKDGEWASPNTPIGGNAGTSTTLEKARACASRLYLNYGYIIWKIYAGLDEREYFPPEKVFEK